jgi:S1-C subfamily serine protease
MKRNERLRLKHLAPVIAMLATAAFACGLQGDYPAPQLGVLVDDTLTVVHVRPDSPAERADFQVGDVLLALDGTPYANLTDWDVAVYRVPLGELYEVTVQRGSSSVILTVTSAFPRYPTGSPGVTPTPVPTGLHWVSSLDRIHRFP